MTRICSVPPHWTDAAALDPEVVMGQGRVSLSELGIPRPDPRRRHSGGTLILETPRTAINGSRAATSSAASSTTALVGKMPAAKQGYCRRRKWTISCSRTHCDSGDMSGFSQLDLFNDRPDFERPSNALSAEPLVPERLTDDELISAIPDATLADARALAIEAEVRRLSAAVPALTSLCNRFVGWGADVVVPEQVAALNALGAIGGPQASRAVARLIVKKIVQGPTLVTATTVASQLGVIFASDVALALLRHPNPLVRAAACACVRSGYEVITTLIAMLDDPDGEVAIASACALGRIGRIKALGHLKQYLNERPSPRIIEALARVADEEAIVFLARAGRARRELTASIFSALEEIDNARAMEAAAALKRSLRRTE